MTNEPIMGVIYPLPNKLAEDLLKRKKNIFYKYLTHSPNKKSKFRIGEVRKLFIYLSGGSKSIIGDAKIKKISFLNASQIIKKYSNSMMGDINHLRNYSKNREDKLLLVLELQNIKKYSQKRLFNKHMSVSGRYFTQSEYNELYGVN